MRYSVLYPEQPAEPQAIRAFAALTRAHGLARLWMGQSFTIESHLALSAAVPAVPVGIGTALAALRTPYDAALQARSLAVLLGQPVSIAYGSADPDFVASTTGSPLADPAAYTVEYARLVKALLAGDVAHSDHPRLRMHAKLPELPHPPVEIGTGVLRPAMARRSASVADFVITWLAPHGYLRDVIAPALARSARPRLVSHVHCAVARPGRSVELIAQVGSSGHLSRPHYVDMLNRAGLDIDVSDPVSGARALVRHGVILSGSPGEIAQRLASFAEIGVDEVVINVTGVALTHGPVEAIRDLDDISSALIGVPG